MKKFLILVFFLSGGVLADTPKSEITGAFGLKLGDVFDMKLAIRELSDNSGGRMFTLNPPKKVRGLNQHLVRITPVTKIIFTIGGGQVFSNKTKCESELSVFKALLTKKYGEFNKDDLSPDATDDVIVGKRAIMLECNYTVSGYRLSVIYLDFELFELGKKEHIEKELQKGGTDDL